MFLVPEKTQRGSCQGRRDPAPYLLGSIYLPEAWLGGYHNTAYVTCRLWLRGAARTVRAWPLFLTTALLLPLKGPTPSRVSL